LTATATATADGYSNVRRGDYVGPEVCGDCHEEKYETWAKSLHATMNQVAGEDSVKGDFSGRDPRFRREGDAFVMDVKGATYRVTRTIGTKWLQEYVGVGAEGVEVRLPYGWWKGRWYSAAHFDSWKEEDEIAVEPWADRCAWCHNTYPFELRAGREVGHGLEQFVAMAAPRVATPVDQLVTVGISCESCHLGGREHVENGRAISFMPRSPDLMLTAVLAGRHDPTVVNAICAQCHSTPAPRFPNGAAVRNSSEALDMAASKCAGIKCTDCHDPHVATTTEVKAEQACRRCHEVDHGRHDAVGCLDCHMPKVVQGISTFVRTHRISSPTDEAMLAIGAPNACGLCHLDQGQRWMLEAIEDGWGRRIEPSWAADYERPMGEVWLHGPVRTYRILAAAAYTRAGRPVRATVVEDRPFYRAWMDSPRSITERSP
jgi:hypothetical protein